MTPTTQRWILLGYMCICLKLYRWKLLLNTYFIFVCKFGCYHDNRIRYGLSKILPIFSEIHDHKSTTVIRHIKYL